MNLPARTPLALMLASSLALAVGCNSTTSGDEKLGTDTAGITGEILLTRADLGEDVAGFRMEIVRVVGDEDVLVAARDFDQELNAFSVPVAPGTYSVLAWAVKADGTISDICPNEFRRDNVEVILNTPTDIGDMIIICLGDGINGGVVGLIESYSRFPVAVQDPDVRTPADPRDPQAGNPAACEMQQVCMVFGNEGITNGLNPDHRLGTNWVAIRDDVIVEPVDVPARVLNGEDPALQVQEGSANLFGQCANVTVPAGTIWDQVQIRFEAQVQVAGRRTVLHSANTNIFLDYICVGNVLPDSSNTYIPGDFYAINVPVSGIPVPFDPLTPDVNNGKENEASANGGFSVIANVGAVIGGGFRQAPNFSATVDGTPLLETVDVTTTAVSGDICIPFNAPNGDYVAFADVVVDHDDDLGVTTAPISVGQGAGDPDRQIVLTADAASSACVVIDSTTLPVGALVNTPVDVTVTVAQTGAQTRNLIVRIIDGTVGAGFPVVGDPIVVAGVGDGPQTVSFPSVTSNSLEHFAMVQLVTVPAEGVVANATSCLAGEDVICDANTDNDICLNLNDITACP